MFSLLTSKVGLPSVFYGNKFMPAPHWIKYFPCLLKTCVVLLLTPADPSGCLPHQGPSVSRFLSRCPPALFHQTTLLICRVCSPCSLMLLQAFSETSGGGESMEKWRFINQKIIMECTQSTGGWKSFVIPTGRGSSRTLLVNDNTAIWWPTSARTQIVLAFWSRQLWVSIQLIHVFPIP